MSSVIGPHVSIGKGVVLNNVQISNSIVDDRTTIENVTIEGSLIGRDVKITGKTTRMVIGDNTQV